MTTKNKVTLSRVLLQTVKRSIAAGYAAWVAFLDPSASLRMTASQFLREFVMLSAVKHLIKEYREQSAEYGVQMKISCNGCCIPPAEIISKLIGIDKITT